ncbi:MAG: TldD/PmbA family protein [candidate division Zixibacteria bacterium]|nr:TldD/PmbA family protein [candidate division Zixibacteria bacterium]
MNPLEIGQRLVERARKLGADEAEAFVQKAATVQIEVKDRQAETVTYKDRNGYGLRVLLDGRMGFAASNDFDSEASDDLIRRLIANTRHHSPDEHNVLPEADGGIRPEVITPPVDETLMSIPIEKKIEKAISIEIAARQTDPRIQQTAWLLYGDESREYAIVSSRGISGQRRHTELYGLAIAMAAECGPDGHPDQATAQTGMCMEVKTTFAALDPVAIGRKAAGFALRMLGAEDGQTDEMEAVFPSETGSSFVDLVAGMVSAELVQKKKSLFSDRFGEMIASETVTMIDDGRLEKGLASMAVDDEGIPTSTREIIRNGRLVGLLYDSYAAHRGQTRSTGNAIRDSYASRPSIGPTNFYLQKGGISRDRLIASVPKGIYITEVSGLHASVDQVTGDFSIPCKGLLIDHGEIARPVSGIMVSGNIFDFFSNITGVADDLTWEVDENVIGVPTFKIGGVKISGK